MFRDLARECAFGHVAESTTGTCQGVWQLWVKWGEWRGESCFLEATTVELERERAGRVHGTLLLGPMEPGDNDSGKIGSG